MAKVSEPSSILTEARNIVTCPTHDSVTTSTIWTSLPFLSFDVEIRRVICSTNAIESINARIRKAVRARGLFPAAPRRDLRLGRGRRGLGRHCWGWGAVGEVEGVLEADAGVDAAADGVF